jgi:hypothetical protein
MIRIPLVDSFAWRKYGVDWVQLDAPRHFYLHSRDSVATVAAQVGLEVRQIVYDSTAFQFEVSEMYRQGKPLHRSNSVGEIVAKFQRISPRYRRWTHDAALLNELELGDQAAFYLERVRSDS